MIIFKLIEKLKRTPIVKSNVYVVLNGGKYEINKVEYQGLIDGNGETYIYIGKNKEDE